MVDTHPSRISGRWKDGYALDIHTVSSVHIGEDEFGHPQFATTRSAIGELLYQLKYKEAQDAVPGLVAAAAAFCRAWKPPIDVVVPVPPSRQRAQQPVLMLAERIAADLGKAYAPSLVRRIRELPELKDVFGYEQRARLLAGAHSVDRTGAAGKGILLFDDLFRSGATLNSITTAFYDEGGARDVYVLTLTRTRSNQ